MTDRDAPTLCVHTEFRCGEPMVGIYNGDGLYITEGEITAFLDDLLHKLCIARMRLTEFRCSGTLTQDEIKTVRHENTDEIQSPSRDAAAASVPQHHHSATKGGDAL